MKSKNTISPLQSTFQTLLVVLFLIAIIFYLGYHIYKLPPPDSPAKFFSDILLAHRGCGTDNKQIPENSLESVRFAHSKKTDGLEFDIQTTADDEVIVFHDLKTLKRLCDIEDSNDGRVGLKTLKELKTYAYKHGEPGETIPTLEQMVQHVLQLNPNAKMMIESKEWVKVDVVSKKLSQVFHKYDLYEKAAVGSFNPYQLYYLKKVDPKIATLLLIKRHMISEWYGRDIKSMPQPLEELPSVLYHLMKWVAPVLDYLHFISCKTWLPSFLGVSVIGVDNKLINSGDFDVEEFQKRGYVINSWVVNNMSDKERLKKLKVAITTDFLFD